MRIQIESTDIVTSIDGVPVRLWEGTTEGGISCQVYVHRLAVRDGEHQEMADLREQVQPAELQVPLVGTLRMLD